MSDDRGAGPSTHEVEVRGVRLRFAAAHMATIAGELEPLHGHNYSVGCRVGGDLTARFVGDRLRRAEAALPGDVRGTRTTAFSCRPRSPLLDLREEEGSWIISHGERLYRFPAAEVAALPIENTTAELIARWIWERVCRVSGGPARADPPARDRGGGDAGTVRHLRERPRAMSRHPDARVRGAVLPAWGERHPPAAVDSGGRPPRISSGGRGSCKSTGKMPSTSSSSTAQRARAAGATTTPSSSDTRVSPP